ncbi:MAG: hypothetical protein NVSMB22_08110 [Chloroflexota bacterium]
MQSTTAGQAFNCRSFRPHSDIPAVVRLLAAVERVDWDGEETSEADLHDQLAWPNHDPVNDRWVVEAPDAPGSLIGYGVTWAKSAGYADIFVATHPSYRRQGIGTILLARAMERARSLGVERAGVYANTLNAASTAFLYTQGFRAASSYWDLLAPPDMPVSEPLWPAGYTVRSFDELHDLNLLVETLNRCYGDLWGHGPSTGDTVADWLSVIPPRNIVLVFGPEGDAAALCRFHTAEGKEPSGYIDAPGVAPEYRDANLHVPLLLTALQRLWSGARFPVRLESWGDDPSVIARYRSLGVSSVRHHVGFERRLLNVAVDRMDPSQ